MRIRQTPLLLIATAALAFLAANPARAKRAADLRTEAQRLYKAGNYAEALPLFDAVLAKKPRDIASRQSRANIYLRLNEPEKALADLNFAIRFAPEIPSLHVDRGIARVMLGLYDQAMVEFRVALALYPFYNALAWNYQQIKREGMASSHCGIAQVFHRTSQDESAVREYTLALSYNPNDPNAYTGRGNSLAALGQLDEALADFDQALRIDPNQSRAYCGRADLFTRKGQDAKALADFDAAVRLDPNYAYARRLRGAFLSRIGQNERALTDFDEVIRRNPKDACALKDRGGLLVRMGRYDRAIEDLNESIRLDPSRPAAYLNRGAAFNSLGQYARALRDLNEAIRRDKFNAGAYTNCGLAHSALGRYDEALQDMSEAIRLDPRNGLYHFNRGAMYAHLEQFEAALRDFDDAIRLEPTMAMAFLHRGLAHSRLGRLEDSVRDFDQAIRLQPGAVRAYVSLGNVHDTLGQLEKALTEYDMAIRLNPADASVYCDRANTRRALGNWDGAIRDFSQAIGLDPRRADTYVARGWLLLIANRDGAESDARAYLDLTHGRDKLAPYMAMLGAFAARRVSREVEARVFLDEALANTDPEAWPAPVLRYLRRGLTPESVLNAARTELQQTEAHAFVGLSLYQAGDRPGAIAHLRWVRDQGVKHSIATDLAEGLLRKIDELPQGSVPEFAPAPGGQERISLTTRPATSVKR